MASNLDALTADLAEQLATPQIVDPRLLPVRFSRLKRMSQSAAHYYDACQRHDDASDSLAFRLGSGVHAMALGTPVVRYSGRRAGKDWDAFAAEHAGKVILNEREWSEASAMSNAIRNHREAYSLLWHERAELESHIAWQYLGRACSSRPDSWNPHGVVELKTTRSSAPGVFSREAIRFCYHAQLAVYREAIEHMSGIRVPKAYIVAVEKEPPHIVTVFQLTERALDAGLALFNGWFDRLLMCEAANVWPGYAEAAVDLDLPDEFGGLQYEAA